MRYIFLLLPFLLATTAQASDLNDTTTLRDSIPAGLAPPAANAPTAFADVISDLPLVPGLSLVKNDDVLFVTPREGRIATTEAMGPVDVDEVYNFYRRTLPQLGWKESDARTYIREGERLRIDAKARDKTTTVTFTVSPSQ